MEQNFETGSGGVDPFPPVARNAFISQELLRIREMLQSELPDAADICFDFANDLRVHIDVRTGEDVAVIECKLPMLGAGLFSDIKRGKTPKHPFYHRVSAQVLR